MFEDSQIWLMIGVIVGAVAVLVMIGVIGERLCHQPPFKANVLSDVEEVIHADFKALEEKVETALTRMRAAEAKINRE